MERPRSARSGWRISLVVVTAAVVVAVAGSALVAVGPLSRHAASPPASGKPAAGEYTVPVDPQFLGKQIPYTAVGTDGYGQAVAAFGNLIAIGAPDSTHAMWTDAGSVQVVNSATGSSYTLNGPDQDEAYFGTSVALGASWLAVGATAVIDPYNTSLDAGAVYLYNATTGAYETTLYSPNAVAGGNFGHSVAVSAPYVVVGAPSESPLGPVVGNSGAAYVFDLATDTVTTLVSPYAQPGGLFGLSVAISGTSVVVSAPGEGGNIGNVYIFSASTGDLTRQITQPTGGGLSPGSSAVFGYSVAISGATLVVGTPYTSYGTVVVYNLASNSSTILTSLHETFRGDFGYSVAVAGSTVVVGAPYESPDSASTAGEVYSFSTVTGDLLTGQFVANPVQQGFGSTDGSQLGISVAIAGSTIIAGAPGQNASGVPLSGTAFLYQDLPLAVATPTVGSGGAYGNFGAAVAVSNGIMIVGAPYSGASIDLPNGQAFLVNTGSGAIVSLSDSYPTYDGEFGHAVAIDKNYAVVGAPDEEANGTGPGGSGNVYVYNASTGAYLRTITSHFANGGGAFGQSVALSGSTVAIGAPGETPEGEPSSAGAAYLFNVTTGQQIAVLHSSYPHLSGDFGDTIGVSGTTVLVGAPFENSSGLLDSGDAYLFTSPHGSYVATVLSDPNWQTGGEFGWSVALSGQTVVVGAPGETNSSATLGVGHAYVFNADSMALTAILYSTNQTEYGQFGYSVATNGASVVVGAPQEYGDGHSDGGNVYLFSWTGLLSDRYFSGWAQSNGAFGRSVGIGPGGVIVAGAPQETGIQGPTGQAYIL